jgi:hypothetical protein
MAKNTHILFIAFLVFALAWCSFAVPARGVGSSSLTVKVYNVANNDPIPGANVTISAVSGSDHRFGVTDVNGLVVFSSIASGNYSIVTSVAQYPSTIAHYIQVDGDTRTYVSFGYTNAYFIFTPYHPATNRTVNFDGSQSTSSGTITSYSWDFGDNTTGTGVAPTHIYTNSGSYTVILTVTSTVGTATYSLVMPISSQAEDSFNPYWFLLLVPFLILIPILLFWRRRRYYIIIQARIPLNQTHQHCPGDNTKCDGCKLTPC